MKFFCCGEIIEFHIAPDEMDLEIYRAMPGTSSTVDAAVSGTTRDLVLCDEMNTIT